VSTANKAPQHQFTVSIDVDLPPATVQKIGQAIQKAVLLEIAGAQLTAPLAIDFLAGGQAKTTEKAIISGGHTQGIAIRSA
jgi:hypothetical protein